MMIRMN